jgi:hypothetical protein
VRWYCKYGISYRDLAEMMQERGVEVDPSTVFRWVQRNVPKIEKRIRPYQGSRSGPPTKTASSSTSCCPAAGTAERVSLPAQSPEDDERVSSKINRH